MRIDKTRSLSIVLLLLLVLTLSTAAPASAAKYTGFNTPSVGDGDWEKLGKLAIEVPAAALSAGDSVVIGLPSGFKYIDDYQNAPTVGANDYTFEGDSKGQVVVRAPERYEGNTNALYDAGSEGIEFEVDLVNQNSMRITLTPALDVASGDNGGYLVVDFNEIFIKSGFRGAIDLDIETAPGSGFAVSGASSSVGEVPIAVEEPKPTPEPVKPEPTPEKPAVTSTFTIGSGQYQVNGAAQTMDAVPYLKNGYTFMPLRYVAYSLGVKETDIVWNGVNQTVTLTKGDKTVQVTIGSNVMLVNGQPVTLETVPEISGGRTMLPLRFVAQAFGAVVSWDEQTKTATISL